MPSGEPRFWAAWWLDLVAVTLVLLEIVAGLLPFRLPTGTTVAPLFQDVATLSVATIGLVVFLLIFGLLDLVIATPFALLGYWGVRRSTRGRRSGHR